MECVTSIRDAKNVGVQLHVYVKGIKNINFAHQNIHLNPFQMVTGLHIF